MVIATWVLVLANLYFGINADFTARIAAAAAEVLIGGGP
jgi:hypothetical protein